jgi:hypothetical protein
LVPVIEELQTGSSLSGVAIAIETPGCRGEGASSVYTLTYPAYTSALRAISPIPYSGHVNVEEWADHIVDFGSELVELLRPNQSFDRSSKEKRLQCLSR